MATLKYWIWLSQRMGGQGSSGPVCRVLEHFGTPEAVYFADPAEYKLLPDLPAGLRAALEDKTLERAEDCLEQCARLNLRILTVQDADYPERLRQLYDYPLVLYLKGKWFPFDEMVAIGMVGSRDATGYGIEMAGRLAMDLTRSGALVVSGIAEGIDTAALKGVLQAGGAPVSVLGCGVDVVYPKKNRGLFEDVAAAGVLISEYPPGTPAEGHHFPVRNRIISGLSLGVAAVEAREHSGTLITMRHALEQSRDTFAVPGNADAPMSRGTNLLIQRQEAKLIMSAADILEEYRGRQAVQVYTAPPLARDEAGERLDAVREFGAARPAERSVRAKREEKPAAPVLPTLDRKTARETLTDDQLTVLEALDGKTLLVDQLVEETQLPARRVASALTILQVNGYVAEGAGKRFTSSVCLK